MMVSGDHLDRMRLITDPPVDAVIAKHLAKDPDSVGTLLRELFRDSGMPARHPLVADYLSVLPEADLRNLQPVDRGQSLFAQWGPEILLTLGSYALPVAYASGYGAQVVHRARRLKEDPIRRLCDTAQMVVNVMQPGSLHPGGVGWMAARKVRLVHALVRWQVRAPAPVPWSMEWGAPINQEDQAGTLLSFSMAAVDGLRRMGIAVSRAESDAYVRAWSAVGWLLGVDASLLPEDEDSATALAVQIGRRQLRATPEGRELMAKLLGAIDSLFPFRGYALSLTHFFLSDTMFGKDIAALLDLPPPNWTRTLVSLRAAQKKVIARLLNVVPGARARRRFVARHFTQALILLRRPDGHAPFAVPSRLWARWNGGT